MNAVIFSYVFVCLQPLGDAYGLLMHRNGQWEWTLAPGVAPSPRYQHAAVNQILLEFRKIWKKTSEALTNTSITEDCTL